MIDNVVSITKYKKADDELTFMHEFKMPPDALLMDFPMQLELLKDRCWGLCNSGNPSGIHIHRLLGLTEKMFANICFSLDEPLFMRIYKDPKNELVFMVRVLSNYLFEIGNAVKKGSPEPKPLFDAKIYFFEMTCDHPEMFIEPPAVMAGEIVEHWHLPASFYGRASEQLTDRIVKNMNTVTTTNCGFAKIVDNTYVAVIPHSEKYCILMTLCLKDNLPTNGVE